MSPLLSWLLRAAGRWLVFSLSMASSPGSWPPVPCPLPSAFSSSLPVVSTVSSASPTSAVTLHDRSSSGSSFGVPAGLVDSAHLASRGSHRRACDFHFGRCLEAVSELREKIVSGFRREKLHVYVVGDDGPDEKRRLSVVYSPIIHSLSSSTGSLQGIPRVRVS